MKTKYGMVVVIVVGMLPGLYAGKPVGAAEEQVISVESLFDAYYVNALSMNELMDAWPHKTWNERKAFKQRYKKVVAGFLENYPQLSNVCKAGGATRQEASKALKKAARLGDMYDSFNLAQSLLQEVD